MGVYNLDKIFEPEAVAIVGASEREGSVGWSLINNMMQSGYQGKIFPVNPRYNTINGLQAYDSLLKIGQPVDLAVIATPIRTVPSLIGQCAQSGVGGVIIVSAGGKEAGEKGKEIEEAIKKEAQGTGIRIIGPNCLGVICTASKVNASFASHMPLPGKLAFISQSGAICTAILDLSLKERIGFSHFVSIGSMLDADFGDLIDYLGNDPEVRSIVLYIESLTHFRKFMSAARAVSRLKPIVVLKSGRCPAGARAAASHTGALAGEDAVYDAAFNRAGILRVDTIEELFDCAELMAKQPQPFGSRLAIITNAGGPGVMAADALAQYGIEPVALRLETIEKLDQVLPPFWSHGNPIDILGDADPERYRKAVEICLSAQEIDALLIIMTPQALTSPTAVASSLAQVLKNQRISVFTSWMGGLGVEEGRQIFNQAGIPTYETPERAVKAFHYMYCYRCNLDMLQEIPPKLPYTLHFDRDEAASIIHGALEKESPLLTEVESKALLSAYGIPVNWTETAASAEEAVELAQEIGYPVVMKLLSKKITHKSDAGGVILNLTHSESVRSAFSQIRANANAYDPSADFMGVTLQPMLSASDYELILGSKKDPGFGPAILFGMGGIMTEILKDRSIALPPLNRLLARRLMENTRVYKLLRGYRNRPAANLVLLEEILIRLSQLVTDFPEIHELDINPMILQGDRAFAVDARVLITSSEVPSPMHLVISPYPNQHEYRTTTGEGVDIFVRPIKPEDAPLLVDLFDSLSPRSIYYRFMSPIKSLSHKMLARFTQIDYDREIALVAIQETDGTERMLGVARVMTAPGEEESEFAILVGDVWQGKGIGAELLQRCLDISKEQGIRKVKGFVLAENRNMLALGRKIGFKMERIPGAAEYELSLDLSKAS